MEKLVVIDHVQPTECPMSIILRNPEIDVMSHSILTALHVQDIAGAFPFGMDSGDWPLKWFDMVRLAGEEDYYVTKAQNEYAKHVE